MSWAILRLKRTKHLSTKRLNYNSWRHLRIFGNAYNNIALWMLKRFVLYLPWYAFIFRYLARLVCWIKEIKEKPSSSYPEVNIRSASKIRITPGTSIFYLKVIILKTKYKLKIKIQGISIDIFFQGKILAPNKQFVVTNNNLIVPMQFLSILKHCCLIV